MQKAISVKKLEIENVKRIKAVKIEPTKTGLTIVGGNNNQGKTSVLDSIAWALGGDRYKPSNATREGSAIPPNLHIIMSNGLHYSCSFSASLIPVSTAAISTQKISQLYYREKERISQMIKYSV